MMKAQISRQKGFTIIELMMVIAIISILAMIAISAYGNYAIRAKIAEGLSFASEAKTAVTAYYAGNNRFPIDNTAAGLPLPTSYDKFKLISKLEVEDDGAGVGTGIITITIKIPALGTNNKLQLVPSTVFGALNWQCRPAPVGGIDTTKVPPNCRGA